MAILIADSGSTKTSWCLLNGSIEERIITAGINPTYHSDETIRAEIDKVRSKVSDIDSIYFYGAGCGNLLGRERIANLLLQQFPNAKTEVHGDLLAACRASSSEPTWVGILGTESNVCFFDGKKITYQPLSLGYVLGSEGSGCDIGKRLLKAYFSDQFPNEIQQKWEEKYTISYDNLLEKVYKKPFANRWMASFAPFAKENAQHPFISALLKETFSTYLEQLDQKKGNKVSYVGSIAYHFRELLSEEIIRKGFIIGSIHKEPMDGLVKFHKEN
ncbi:MAG: BadF/BadG/BcrA/BcrD ATPase family protein [Cyclobacteriaceae bacterium]